MKSIEISLQKRKNIYYIFRVICYQRPVFFFFLFCRENIVGCVVLYPFCGDKAVAGLISCVWRYPTCEIPSFFMSQISFHKSEQFPKIKFIFFLFLFLIFPLLQCQKIKGSCSFVVVVNCVGVIFDFFFRSKGQRLLV